ncbi:MAG: TrbC/VirB2 family type IV secretion system protein, partial [Burkholderiales bacterium]
MSIRIKKHLTSLSARKRAMLVAAAALLAAVPAFAQQAGGGSPWENAVGVLEQAFTGPIATGLSLVAIVLGGLMFAYGEGQSKRMLAGIVFGI